MIKRGNKITALLVSAATVISITPATAVLRLEAKEGTIENAIVFRDGKYVYEGSKADETTGLYYNDGSNEKYLEEPDEFDDNAKFADKYAVALDGSDQYLIDLSDGTVSDGNTRESLEDEARNRLESRLSKANRYGDNVQIKSFKQVSEGQFGSEPWYEYTATGDEVYYKDVIGDIRKEQESKNTIQVKTRIKIEVTQFYSDIQIAGKVFKPAWGSNLPEGLASAVKDTKFENYVVESAVAEKGADNNQGKVTVVLGSAQELTQVPDGILLFDYKTPEEWMQMKAEILSASSKNGSGSTTTTTDNTTTSTDTNTTINTTTNNNTNTTTTTPTVNQQVAKSQITLDVTKFWGDITIAGALFKPAWGSDDLGTLASEIKNTQFTGYEVKSAETSNGKLTAIFIAANQLNELPHKFTTGLSYYNDYSSGNFSSVNVEKLSTGTNTNPSAKTKITLVINNFYGKFTIAGKEFSPNYWLNGSTDTMANLVTEINAATFTDYTLESATLGNGSVTIAFSTDEILDELPNGFVTGLGNGSYSLNGSASIKLEQIMQSVPTPTTTTGAAASATTSSTVGVTTGASVSVNTGGTVSTTTGAAVSVTTGAGVTVTGDGNTDTSSDESTIEEVKNVLYYGYTDGKGNYIDCSKIANISIYDGNEIVKFDKFDDKKIVNGKTVAIGLPTLEKTLGQDENYIYSLISVPVFGYQRVNGDKYADDAEVKLYFIQKIAKVNGKKEKEAYLPSKVESYQLNNDAGWTGGDNWSYMAAYNMLVGDDASRKIKIIDGNVFVAHDDNSGSKKKVSYGKLKFKKKGKITPVDSKKDSEVYAPIVYEDYANDTEADSWTIDANGNAWAIYDGEIKKSAQGNAFQVMYKCDDSLNKLDVYDDDNLIAWEDDGDFYVTAMDIEGKSATKTGWHRLEDGKWHLYDLSGKPVIGWVMFGSGWYYMNDQGVMQTGWISDKGKTYYLAESGIMKTGWVKVEGKWYYLDQSGARQQNTTINGYVLDSNGIWIQ